MHGRRTGGEALGPPVFGRSVNPISAREADHANHITTCPLGFSDLLIALYVCKKEAKWTKLEREGETVVAELYVAVEQHLQSIDLRARFAMVFCRPAY